MGRTVRSAQTRAMRRLASRLQRERYDSYREYLAGAHWQALKAAYRTSDLPQACPCGETAVDLHHRTYRRLGAERLTDLVPLCRDHHYQLHRLARRESTVGMNVETSRFLKRIAPP